MRHKEIFRAYYWLVDTIRCHGPISLEELGRRWQRWEYSEGKPLSRTSFNRHREEIEDAFGIRIKCDRSNGCRYSIEQVDSIRPGSSQEYMIQSLSISNMITECQSIRNRIILEPLHSDPAYLHTILDAMRNNLIIELSYRRYTDDESWSVCVEPYCIKLHQRRWYLLARNVGNGKLRVFSLDRVLSASATDQRFKHDADFDAEAYFSECYGVIRDETLPVERIILRAYGMQRHYMRDLPLHPSQRRLSNTDNSIDFELTLRPTADLMAHILSCGRWLEVVSPQHLADRILGMARETVARYSLT